MGGGMRRFGLVTAHAAEDWHAGRLAAALSAHGPVEVVDPSRLSLACGSDGLRVEAEGSDVRRFDAVLLGRVCGPHADADVQLDLARAIELVGVPTFNRVEPMLHAQDKLWTCALLSRAGVPTPAARSLVTGADVRRAVAAWHEAVLKPLFGSLGEGLARLGPESGCDVTDDGGPRMLQRFVETGGVDYRLFVVGGEVKACVRRTAPRGDWRSNAARGAGVAEASSSREWDRVALAAARALGLDFAGVDLAVTAEGPTVLEVNGVPNFRAVFEATGRDMARAMAAWVAVRAARTAARPARPSEWLAAP
jgi:tetrahydromethanopterin:alpha-L-glutamate ligase